jgi:hypothetical protein
MLPTTTEQFLVMANGSANAAAQWARKADLARRDGDEVRAARYQRLSTLNQGFAEHHRLQARTPLALLPLALTPPAPARDRRETNQVAPGSVHLGTDRLANAIHGDTTMSATMTTEQATERQVAFLQEYNLETTDNKVIASQRIQAFLDANPEIREQRRQAANDKRRQTLAARKADQPAPSSDAPESASAVPALKRYLEASQKKSAARGVAAPSENQIRKILHLIAEGQGVTENAKINARTALSGGVTQKHASVIIAKLEGTFVERKVQA